jgi:hypothetical protein
MRSGKSVQCLKWIGVEKDLGLEVFEEEGQA